MSWNKDTEKLRTRTQSGFMYLEHPHMLETRNQNEALADLMRSIDERLSRVENHISYEISIGRGRDQ